MIIVKLMGGMGNQMFQYALGRSLSVKNSCRLKIDISGYRTYKTHDYSLDVFALDGSTASKKECDSIMYKKCGLIELAARKILRKQKKKTENYVLEKSFRFDPAILELNKDKYLEGYWQSEKYFASCMDIIRADFTLKSGMNDANAAVYKRIKETNSISLHIKRGDYISNPKTKAYHGVDLGEYYKDAVKFFKQNVRNPHFFVFSDEPQWVVENLSGEFKFTVVDCNTGKTGYEDMRLMSACSHNIIANSSFSWWAAWLNMNKDKIVIAPKKWFTDGSIYTTDLVPVSWIRI